MTTLREAAQQALSALEREIDTRRCKVSTLRAMNALRAALAKYDKDLVKVEEMKANWSLQRKLAEETQERDKQQREYEEQQLAALAEPVQEPVAWRFKAMIGMPWSLSDDGYYISCKRDQRYFVEALYTAPPRKPLTEGEIDSI